MLYISRNFSFVRFINVFNILREYVSMPFSVCLTFHCDYSNIDVISHSYICVSFTIKKMRELIQVEKDVFFFINYSNVTHRRKYRVFSVCMYLLINFLGY